MVHAARRHDALDIEHLALLTGTRIGHIGLVAAAS